MECNRKKKNMLLTFSHIVPKEKRRLIGLNQNFLQEYAILCYLTYIIRNNKVSVTFVLWISAICFSYLCRAWIYSIACKEESLILLYSFTSRSYLDRCDADGLIVCAVDDSLNDVPRINFRERGALSYIRYLK